MEYVVFVASSLGLVLYYWRKSKKKKQSPSESAEPYVIEGFLSLHEAYEGIICTGGPGSGKTSGPLTEIYLNLLLQGAGILWLCAKVDEYRGRVLPLCRAAGRLDDVVRFAPDAHERCDVLNEELNSPGGSVDSAAALLEMLSDLSCRSKPGSGGDDAFWAKQNAKSFRRAVFLIKRLTGSCSIADVYMLFCTAANSLEEAASPQWRTSAFCGRLVSAAIDLMQDEPDLAVAARYWGVEWPALDPKTRGICMAMATGCMDPFMSGPMTRLVAGGETTHGPGAVLAGKILCIDMPTLLYQEQGVFFSVLMKILVQRAVLRRETTKDSKVVAIFADECQNFIVGRQDMMVSTMARSSKLVVVNTFQNLPLMYASMGGGDQARQEVDAWASCHMTKIAMGNTCPTTGDFYSKLFGSSFQEVWGGSLGGAGGFSFSDAAFGRPQKNGPSLNWNQNWRPDVPSESFSMLRKPNPARPVAEGYIHQGGKIYGNGKTWARIDFNQVFFPEEPLPDALPPIADFRVLERPQAAPPASLESTPSTVIPVIPEPTNEPARVALDGDEFTWI